MTRFQHYAQIPRGLFRRGLTPGEIALFTLLGTYANPEGWCWPKHRTLADMLGVGRTFVVEHIARLAALGLIEIEAQYDPVNGGQRENRYRLCFERLESNDSNVIDLDPLPAERQGGVAVAAGGCRDGGRGVSPGRTPRKDSPEQTHMNPRNKGDGEGSLRQEKTGTSKRASAFPKNWAEIAERPLALVEVPPALREIAARTGAYSEERLAEEFCKFASWHQAKGSVFVDWRLCFRTWWLRVEKRHGQQAPHRAVDRHGRITPEERRRLDQELERAARAASCQSSGLSHPFDF